MVTGFIEGNNTYWQCQKRCFVKENAHSYTSDGKKLWLASLIAVTEA